MSKTENGRLCVGVDLHKTQFTVCAMNEEGEYLLEKKYEKRGNHSQQRIMQKKGEINMAIEQVKKLLEAIKSDPKAQELLQGVSEPKNGEEMIRLCAEVAPKLGFDVTEAEIRQGIAQEEWNRRENTDAAAEQIQKLSDSEVENAAGGSCSELYALDTSAFGECEKDYNGGICDEIYTNPNCRSTLNRIRYCDKVYNNVV